MFQQLAGDGDGDFRNAQLLWFGVGDITRTHSNARIDSGPATFTIHERDKTRLAIAGRSIDAHIVTAADQVEGLLFNNATFAQTRAPDRTARRAGPVRTGVRFRGTPHPQLV